MTAKTIKGKSIETIEKLFLESRSGAFVPTLAIVFASIKQDIAAISNLFDKEGIQVFGATTAGEFIDGNVEEGSIVIMLLDIQPAYFKIYFEATEQNDYRDIGRNIGNYGKEVFSNPEFIIGVAGWGAQGEFCLRGIEEIMGEGNCIFGAVAGDDNKGKGAVVFTNGKLSGTAIIALILDADKISMKGIATSGWQPLGIERRVTKSKDNIVYTIEDQPALDIFQKYLDDAVTDIKEGNTWVLKNNAFFPILIQQENTSPMVRTGRAADLGERSIAFAGPVAEGARFRFCQPPDFEIVDKVIADANQEIKNSGMPDADALILFSCVSRFTILGPLIGEEIDGLKNLWNKPLVGFFSYGEIGRAENGKNELHNTTCCLVALKEK